jgi:hypothetical protein
MISNGSERPRVSALASPGDLPWEWFRSAGLATKPHELPAHLPGHVRGVHHTLPGSINLILNHGLYYDDNPVEPRARWTILDWTYEDVQSGDEVRFRIEDPLSNPKVGPGSVAIILDISYEEWYLHNSAHAPGFIPADRIVGIINGREESGY